MTETHNEVPAFFQGRLRCAVILWPHTWPSYGELWAWCDACCRPTDDVGYVSTGPTGSLFCHACVVRKGWLCPEIITGTYVVMPRSLEEDYGDEAWTMCTACEVWSDKAPPCPHCGSWGERWPPPPPEGWHP